MENNYRERKFLLAFIALLLLVSCTKKNTSEEQAKITPEPLRLYTHNGLTLRVPQHWKFAYDESPSLYADRGVSFNVSEISGASVFIYKSKTTHLSTLADYDEKSLNLNSNNFIKNYQRKTVDINGTKGERLLWNNTMFESTKVEITILPITQAPSSTFVVFHLLDDDIENEVTNFIPFINSIEFQ